ncbi:hypothetical protein ZWY2020_030133 [Hordeum vulgare]|nr:hypothetical protein ZWY2020_030133 [Hordeum vulgare]
MLLRPVNAGRARIAEGRCAASPSPPLPPGGRHRHVPASHLREGHRRHQRSCLGAYRRPRQRDVLLYTERRRPNGRQPLLRPGVPAATSPRCKYDAEVRSSAATTDASPKLYAHDGLYKVESSTHGPVSPPRGSSFVAPARTRAATLGAPPGPHQRADAKIRRRYLTMDMSTGKEAVAAPSATRWTRTCLPRSSSTDARAPAVPKPAGAPQVLYLRQDGAASPAARKRNGGRLGV